MNFARGAQSLGLLLCILAGPAWAAQPGSLKFPDAVLEPAAWPQLDGWTADNHAAAFTTFLASCRAILSEGKAAPAARWLLESMKAACRRAKVIAPASEEEARAFFEKNFLPVHVAKMGDPEGFLTGYYEPVVAGSRFPTPEYTVPIYRRPGDLVAAGGRTKTGIFSNKGAVYRKIGRKRVPYYTRAEIEDGALDGRQLEICWLKDPIDAFFIHIQGSARIKLEDGSMLRINYDAHNGHRYLPVGRILIERGGISKEEMSMERIRQWMLAHPDEGRALRRMNDSFVFFRITGLGHHEEPVGAEGVSLTPGRSIAVDSRLHLYGTLFWIEAQLPIESEAPATKFHRLMVAQDTGSAIVGPSRADIYWGAGEEAGLIGGRIKQPGRFVMLVPREVDPFAKWRQVPLPREKPETAMAVLSQATQPTGVEPVPLPVASPRRSEVTQREPRRAVAAARQRHHANERLAHPRKRAAPLPSSWAGRNKVFAPKPEPVAGAKTRVGAAKRQALARRP